MMYITISLFLTSLLRRRNTHVWHPGTSSLYLWSVILVWYITSVCTDIPHQITLVCYTTSVYTDMPRQITFLWILLHAQIVYAVCHKYNTSLTYSSRKTISSIYHTCTIVSSVTQASTTRVRLSVVWHVMISTRLFAGATRFGGKLTHLSHVYGLSPVCYCMWLRSTLWQTCTVCHRGELGYDLPRYP
jgi:hypothetical protein